MTRKFIESVYNTILKTMTNADMLDVVIKESEGHLKIGLQTFSNSEEVDNGVCLTKTVECMLWNADKPLTMRQLIKISNIWNELILQSEYE